MEPFLVLIAIILFFWWISHLNRTGERIKKLEKEVEGLREMIARENSARSHRESSGDEQSDEAEEVPESSPTSAIAPAASSLQRAKEISKPSSKEPISSPEESPLPVASIVPPPLPQPAKAPEPEKSSPPPPPPPSQETSPAPAPVPPSSPEASPEPVPLSAASTISETEEEEPSAVSWRPYLEKLKLWPPTGENAEATIAAWWLTRLGLIILIISAVFFGVRIAEDTPPWVRLAALALISVGVVIGGSFLERRLQAFGRLISAGGLALGYFTAFAAYGVEATKVIDNPGIGLLVQIFAVIITVGWSFWKDEESIATMATLLGYVACWFSFHHDLDHFVVAGLLILAAAAATFLTQRRWLWPIAVATVASWFGILLLAALEWSRPGEAPAFLVILGSLLLLTTILEIANLLAYVRGKPDDLEITSDGESGTDWLKRLALLNTSLAIGIGWVAVRLAFPNRIEVHEIDVFYLSFALLMGVFSFLRFRNHHPLALTEVYFLKASGLLALFFVAWFDGPTRWLALAAQTVVLLGTWRRSRLVWIEVGFAALLIATLILVVYDALQLPSVLASDARIFSVAPLVGILSMAFLSTCLAFHARWTKVENREPEDLLNLDYRSSLRFFAAIAVGLTLLTVILAPLLGSPPPRMIALLSLAAVLLASPSFLAKTFPPIPAGLTVLLPAFFLFFFLGRTEGGGWLGAWLTILGIGAAELVFRFWRQTWPCGNGLRFVFHGLGVVALGFTLQRTFAEETPPSLPIALTILLGLVAVSWGCLARQAQNFRSPHRSRQEESRKLFLWGLCVVTGVAVLRVGYELLAPSPYVYGFLALAGGLLFSVAYVTRNAAPALAGGIPLVVALLAHLFRYGESDPFWNHFFSALLIIGVCWATLIALKRSVDLTRHPKVYGMAAVLHGISLLLIHWILRSYLDPPEAILGDCLLALAALFAHRRFDLPTLASVSGLPIVLALIHYQVASISGELEGVRWLWWASAAAVGSWLYLGHRWFFGPGPDGESDPILRLRRSVGIVHVALTAAALAFLGSQAAPVPWQVVAMAGFSLGLASLGRWGGLSSSQVWSLIPLLAGSYQSLKLVLGWETAPQGQTLAAVTLTAIAICVHGVILSWRESREKRGFTWAHGLVALALAFLAYSSNRLGVESLTTVCWGLSSITLFGVGLAVGLRPYRLTGLIGLAVAMIRMFAVDIVDPLYRIYAFFAIALVLLGIGYLYQRFRHLIDRADLTADRKHASTGSAE